MMFGTSRKSYYSQKLVGRAQLLISHQKTQKFVKIP
eukprot:UN14364